INSFGLSPSGARALFGARGEVFTVPGKKGDTRNLTGTPGARELFPEWSPDGKWIAYFSDKTGDYELAAARKRGLRLMATPSGLVRRGPPTPRRSCSRRKRSSCSTST